ncbi:unnamed protein product [Angiostrongylus costaricensis]|uniref:DIRP domain-containing protein n=1 Tax=Angiostrongylus costaricensis TaxID=334426 RepID=A0A0R3PM96_ANGCS|nr:unnamed protein product [Angiostrongylus costaricensis]
MSRSPLKSPARKKIAGIPSLVRDKSSSPYKLRDTSKLPSRYRDEEIDVPPLRSRTPVKPRTPLKNTLLFCFSHRSQNEIGSELQCSLRRAISQPHISFQARQWVICEFFYSGVDEQLFLGDNEFRQLIREAFPNLKTTLMNKQEWRVIRRLLGKPRRCSTTFFDEERQILDQRRRKVRGIYDGSYTVSGNCDLSDMPPNLPAPLVVGMKVYARVRTPKDGIYGGTIDALVPGGGGYRVVFDKEDMIPPAFVPDSEVMFDGSLQLLSLSYFLQQNHARLPVTLSSFVFSTESNEKVGNFPVRMLVILVKVAKLLEIKKKLVKTLTELNDEAERESILTDVYTSVFQERYARTVVDLETINRQVNIYLSGIQDYNTQLLPQLSEVSISARPEALRRMCTSHANQIVKHCNQGLNVTNTKALRLITALTSLLLQIRSLGQQKMSPMDLTALNDSVNEIHQMISPRNYNCFQDHVEVHMRQVHNVMLKSGAILT